MTQSSRGVAEEVTDPGLVEAINGGDATSSPSHLFRLDLHEVSAVRLAESGAALVIGVWTPRHGVRTISLG